MSLALVVLERSGEGAATRWRTVRDGEPCAHVHRSYMAALKCKIKREQRSRP